MSEQPPGTASQTTETVVGSRSCVYAMFLATCAAILGVGSVGLLQSFALVIGIAMPLVCAARSSLLAIGTAPAIVLCVFAACLGSAPFYTIYLMPDIFTPILILCVGSLVVFSGAMKVWELVSVAILAAVSAMMHPSNLIILFVMIPVIGIATFLVPTGRRKWIGLILCAAVLSVGAFERYAFKTAVQVVKKAEVIHYPFLTVRLIVDGPGMRYLKTACNAPVSATCQLYEVLDREPQRIDPSLIMFAKDPEHGSLRLLEEKVQRQVANEQKRICKRGFKI